MHICRSRNRARNRRKNEAAPKKSDISFTAPAISKIFTPKKFPKGLGAGLWAVQVTKEDGVWKDFCKVLKDSGNDWDIQWATADGATMAVPKNILAMSIQKDQELIIRGRLVTCIGYWDNKVHFNYGDLKSGDEDAYVPPKKKAKTTKKPATRHVPVPNPTNPNKKTTSTKKKSAAKPNASTKKKSAANEVVDVEALAVATVKALTKKCDPDKETLDESHTRITDELAAAYQALILEKWERCRYAALTAAVKAKVSQTYDRRELHLPYQFVERTVQTYVGLQKDMQEHVEAQKYLLGAVQATLTTIPKKLTAKCEAQAIAVRLRPLLDSVFSIEPKKKQAAAKAAKTSTEAYEKMLIKKDSYTYAHICKYHLVWEHYLASMMKQGDAKGYPKVEEGETIPTAHDVYDAATAIPEYKVQQRRAHPEVPLFRYATLTNALL